MIMSGLLDRFYSPTWALFWEHVNIHKYSETLHVGRLPELILHHALRLPYHKTGMDLLPRIRTGRQCRSGCQLSCSSHCNQRRWCRMARERLQ